MSANLSNRDKMMVAAIDLIAEKGYKAATTKEIAEAAGLSEKTLFRHFGTKQCLLEMAFERFHYGGAMSELFEEKIVGDLEEDLLLITQTYHENMNRNRKMIMISIKERENMPGFHEKAHRHPTLLRKYLTEYFLMMQEQGKMRKTDPENAAKLFLVMNFGAFMQDFGAEDGLSYSLEDFIHESVKLFVNAYTPV